jgi:hypothetical protein
MGGKLGVQLGECEKEQGKRALAICGVVTLSMHYSFTYFLWEQTLGVPHLGEGAQNRIEKHSK